MKRMIQNDTCPCKAYHARMSGRTLLKCIGIALFLWILLRIDRAELWKSVALADVRLLLLGFGLFLLSHLTKAVRWHALVQSTGLKPTFGESWKIYHIGIFLGNITPGNLGEFGRAAYLKLHGVSLPRGLLLGLIDRLSDAIAMGIVAIAGVGILFGAEWLAFALLAAGAATVGSYLLRGKKILQLLAIDLRPALVVTASTVASWVLYFAWTILVARSIGIDIGLPVLISAITLTGIITLLPVSPAGLGTREASFILLLAPYGIGNGQAVALSLLMFAFIVLGSTIGGWYWLTRRQREKTAILRS
jgi:glycosyltransferase 2 family protein